MPRTISGRHIAGPVVRQSAVLWVSGRGSGLVKPSRFGSVERLFAAYDHCDANGIGAYGGGQWELGIGRGHIQLLAALMHPTTPNDVAPREYNLEPAAGLPTSPLQVRPRETGFLAL